MTRAGLRTRSLNGCATCRARHVKCDEQRPKCMKCRSLGVPCGGYGNRITFTMNEEGCLHSSRRPLLRDSERKLMSEAIVRSIQEYSVSGLLSQIELGVEDQNNLGPSTEIQCQHGPFGAFRTQQVPPVTTSGSVCKDKQLPSDSSVNLDTLIFPDFSENLLGFDLGAEHYDMPEPSDLQLDGSAEFSYPWPGDMSTDIQIAQNTIASPALSAISAIGSPQSPPGSFSIKGLPMDEIIFLMSKYKDTVIPLLSPLKRTKTMWHVIFLTGGLNTLSALTLKAFPGNASLVELFSILSITAMSMRDSPESPEWERWNTVGLQYLARAENLLEATLSKAFLSKKEAKYKTILAAILGVLQASTFAGVWENTEKHILDAERFIRLKGLSKRDKSRRVRFLHHCYGYQRLFYESTYVLQDCTVRRKYRRQIRQTKCPSPGEDNVSFRLIPCSSDLEKEMQETKPRDSGENDLHLSMPGIWNLSFYSEIYDVPESFLFLLSQVIRLYNEKIIPSESSTTERIGLSEFLHRAKLLERCISEWQPPLEEINARYCAEESQETTKKGLKNMLEALHQSLMIYFYRMIYDVETVTIQDRVVFVMERLTDMNPSDIGAAKFTAAFLWPSFIAASEALDPAVQAAFDQWFDFNIRCCNLQTYTTTLQIVKDVWSLRRSSNDTRKSWIDVLQERDMCIFWS